MKRINLDGIYSDNQWLESVTVTVDDLGNILSISEQTPVQTDIQDDENTVSVSGYAIPSFKNAHSHAFQYAMAGLSEYRGPSSTEENFWTWRDNMYKLALSLSPVEIQTIAESLFLDLLIQGYTHTVEFHYLQNDTDGSQYSDPLTLYHPIIQAAENTGMALTLTPVFYKNSDFNRPASHEQRRFVFKSVDSYLKLIEKLQSEVKKQNKANEKTKNFAVALGVHSLRAASIDELQKIVEQKSKSTPFHIHISEQIKEVQACQSAHKKNPIELLFDSVDVDRSFNLVHATHASPKEIKMMIDHQANVVLCPTTEANLGDGLFPLESFHGKGVWSIGSDSHVCRDPLEELRWLDYGQRLKRQVRNPICKNNQFSGDQLIHGAVDAQAAFCQTTNGRLTVGQPFNATVYPSDSATFSALPPKQRLSHLIFSGHAQPIKGVFVTGVWLDHDALKQKKQQSDSELKLRLRNLFK